MPALGSSLFTWQEDVGRDVPQIPSQPERPGLGEAEAESRELLPGIPRGCGRPALGSAAAAFLGPRAGSCIQTEAPGT